MDSDNTICSHLCIKHMRIVDACPMPQETHLPPSLIVQRSQPWKGEVVL